MLIHSDGLQPYTRQISDFLLEGNVYWNEISNGILFFDNIPSQNICSKQIHHFRSFTVKEEATYFKECWQKCYAKRVAKRKQKNVEKTTKESL